MIFVSAFPAELLFVISVPLIAIIYFSGSVISNDDWLFQPWPWRRSSCDCGGHKRTGNDDGRRDSGDMG
jgi:hypothetical protein